MGSSFVGLFMAAAGLFSLLGGALDWDFFMNHAKARFFVELVGRTGARLVYVLLGVALIAVGVAAMTGALPIGNARGSQTRSAVAVDYGLQAASRKST